MKIVNDSAVKITLDKVFIATIAFFVFWHGIRTSNSLEVREKVVVCFLQKSQVFYFYQVE